MKSFLMTAALFVLTMSANAFAPAAADSLTYGDNNYDGWVSANQGGDSRLEISQFTVKAGGEAEFEVNLINPNDSVCAVQFDLVLPEGIRLVLNDTGKQELVSHRERRIFAVAASRKDGSFRILAFSTRNYTYPGTEGSIMTVKVKADDSVAPGTYPLLMKNTIISRLKGGKSIAVRPAERTSQIQVAPLEDVIDVAE